jgi:hypothetical protein
MGDSKTGICPGTTLHRGNNNIYRYYRLDEHKFRIRKGEKAE